MITPIANATAAVMLTGMLLVLVLLRRFATATADFVFAFQSAALELAIAGALGPVLMHYSYPKALQPCLRRASTFKLFTTNQVGSHTAQFSFLCRQHLNQASDAKQHQQWAKPWAKKEHQKPAGGNQERTGRTVLLA